MSRPLSLDTVPQEIIEHIALFAATDSIIGPPSGLLPFLSLSRNIYRSLSISSNPHLYARIFTYKFDINAPIRRLGPQVAAAPVLSKELQIRCKYLSRMRANFDSKINTQGASQDICKGTIVDILWMAYLMMLENDGKNELQLREYARIESWLQTYWFETDGASWADRSFREAGWPNGDEKNTLATWLFWFLLKPDQRSHDHKYFGSAMKMFKLMSLAANRYQLCWPPWTEFLPERRPNNRPSPVTHFSHTYALTPPPLSAGAILSFMNFSFGSNSRDLPFTMPYTMSDSMPSGKQSYEWECEWQKCYSLGERVYSKRLSGSFTPGSIEGVWQGAFTYTDFGAYAALLAGASPQIAHQSLIAHHGQNWKLREYNYMGPANCTSDHSQNSPAPLPIGDALKAFFPSGMHIEERSSDAQIYVPGIDVPFTYRRWSSAADRNPTNRRTRDSEIQDVIIVGEGHSAWGQFNLRGRVRPCDGFITFLKEYVDGDRGKWLYRGYLVGNIGGNLSGRWRDTLSPSHVPGYEGSFAMSRRR